jgi:hypothetical protein
MTQEALKHLKAITEAFGPDAGIELDQKAWAKLHTAIKKTLAQPEQEPVAWFRYQQGSRVYYDSKKWDDCQPLYTQSASDYERGFIDGMQKQMQSSVDKAVNAMSQRPWVGLTDEDISEIVRGTHNTGSFVRAIDAKLKEKNSA